jgi:AAA domain-containing protein/TIR domain-containing protein
MEPSLNLIAAGDGLQRPRIFISYKRNIEPDETVAHQVFEALRTQYDVFIDNLMPLGTVWAERIESEIRSCDFFIVFLSPQSIHSEMVKSEIEKAYQYSKETRNRPYILPVRLALEGSLPYSVGPYLNHINWAAWESHTDTPRVIESIKCALSGDMFVACATAPEVTTSVDAGALALPTPSAQPTRPVQLDMPEGTMDTESRFYVERPFDSIALATIERQGVTMTIKGPRQMGKSSLLMRIINAAQRAGKRTAFLDFQLFDKAALADGDFFFRQFCSWLSDVLEMEDQTARYWSDQLGNGQRCTRYVGRYILHELGSPLVLAMDEVDSIFESPFRSDFFGMLRHWHNSRAVHAVWKRLDLVLVTSTEPYQLIENLNQSPFNVGEVIELTDFTLEQVSDLNRRHGSPLQPEEERRLMALLNGHPYLVRRALYLIASGRIAAAQLFRAATEDRGPFGDHLRYHLFRLHDKPALVEGLRQIIRYNSCADDLIFFRLHGAGLVKREGGKVLPRCHLYADFFREHLNV